MRATVTNRTCLNNLVSLSGDRNSYLLAGLGWVRRYFDGLDGDGVT